MCADNNQLNRVSRRRWDPADPRWWPDANHELLLRAALSETDVAVQYWRQWRAENDLDDVDAAAYFILPQLFLNLKQTDIPVPLLDKLRGIYRYTWTKNQFALQLLFKLLKLFQEHRITVSVIKGVPLLLFYYRDFGARLMADIDLLVREEDVPAAVGLIEQAGWSLDWPLPEKKLMSYVRAAHCIHAKRSVMDLHWRRFTIDCSYATEQRLAQYDIEQAHRGLMLRHPDTTELLLAVCFHSRKGDAQASCRWVLDAAKLISSTEYPVNWNALLDRAQQTGLLLPVRDALCYLQQTFSVAVPEDVIRRLQKAKTNEEDFIRYRELAQENDDYRSLSDALASHWWRFKNVPQPGKKTGIGGFIHYYLAYKQWQWQLSSPRQVPYQVLLRACKRILN